MNLTAIQIDALNQSIDSLTAIEHDLHRISHIDDTAAGLVSDCCEHRRQMLNKLRHIRQRCEPLRPQELMLNSASGPCGEPEIAPEPVARIPSALAEFRRRQRCENVIAWVIAIAALLTLGGCIRFAILNLK